MKTLLKFSRPYLLLGALTSLVVTAPITTGVAQGKLQVTSTPPDVARAGKASATTMIGPRQVTATSSDGVEITTVAEGTVINLGETEVRLRGNSIYHEGEVLVVVPSETRQLTVDWQDGHLRVGADGRVLLNRQVLEPTLSSTGELLLFR